MRENNTKTKRDLFMKIGGNNSSSRNAGITLIILIITIVILIILVTINLNFLLGDNGIINRAKYARDKYLNSSNEESKNLEEIYSQLLLADSKGTSLQNIDMITLKQLILDTTYPVGSIYITTDIKNPSESLGGTWEKYAQGRTIIGDGEDQDGDSNGETLYFVAGNKGGEYNHTLTIAEMPSHTHRFTNGGNALVLHSNLSVAYNQGFSVQSNAGWWYDANKYESSIASSGQSNAHNNIQPYIVTYIWKRIS